MYLITLVKLWPLCCTSSYSDWELWNQLESFQLLSILNAYRKKKVVLEPHHTFVYLTACIYVYSIQALYFPLLCIAKQIEILQPFHVQHGFQCSANCHSFPVPFNILEELVDTGTGLLISLWKGLYEGDDSPSSSILFRISQDNALTLWWHFFFFFALRLLNLLPELTPVFFLSEWSPLSSHLECIFYGPGAFL